MLYISPEIGQKVVFSSRIILFLYLMTIKKPPNHE
jgi:hypothetical protein